MAESMLSTVNVSCRGEKEAIAKLTGALKDGSNQGAAAEAVKKVLDYIERLGEIKYKEDEIEFEASIDGDSGDGRWDDLPTCFAPLTRAFPEVVFVFDIFWEGTAAGCWGNGRHYSIYEEGVKVYDANCWIEQLFYFSMWAEFHGGNDVDFYELDDDEKKKEVARTLLMGQGRDYYDITDLDIEDAIWDYNLEEFGGGMPVYNEARCEFLIDEKDYFYWARNLRDNRYSDSESFYDTEYGWEHYLELKEEGLLPQFYAKSRWPNIFDLNKDYVEASQDDEEDDEDEDFEDSDEDENENDDFEDEVEEKDSDEDDNIDTTIKTEKAALETVTEDGSNLKTVPMQLRTEKVCIAAVKHEKWNNGLEYVPDALRTEELCLAALENGGLSLLEHVPKALFESENFCSALKKIALAKLSENGFELKQLSETMRTEELCLAAVQEDMRAIEHVPDAVLKSKSFRAYAEQAALSAVKKGNVKLNNLPEALRSAEICLAAVQKDKTTLKYVPEDLRTEELCMSAIHGGGWGKIYEHIPQVLFKSTELCLAVVKEDSSALEHIPEELRTAEICLAALKRSSYNALEHVPVSLFESKEFCLAAIQESGSALEHIPENLRTAEICLAAIKNEGSLEHVPEAMRTAEVCLAAMQNEWALKHVPEALFKSPEFCLAAVQKNGSALDHVPQTLRTAEVCLAAVRQEGNALQYVPEELRSAEICLAAVLQEGRAIKYVPEELRIVEMYRVAALTYDLAAEKIPEEQRTAEEFRLLAAAYRSRGRKLRSLLFYDKAIEKDPKLHRAYSGRAAAYADAERYQDSIAEYTKAIELCPEKGQMPEEGTYYANRAAIYEATGEYSAELADLEKALELKGDDEELQKRKDRCKSRLESGGSDEDDDYNEDEDYDDYDDDE